MSQLSSTHFISGDFLILCWNMQKVNKQIASKSVKMNAKSAKEE